MKLLGVSQGTDLSPNLLKLVQSPISDGNPVAQSNPSAVEMPFQEKPPSPKGWRPVKIEENPRAVSINQIYYQNIVNQFELYTVN